MSYNVHNFRNGSVINAGPINEMDQQIFSNTVDIEGKLDSPTVAGTSGQVLSIDDNSNVVWATPQVPDVPVTDVQVNGTSVLNDGDANIPIASSTRLGVVKSNQAKGVSINPNNGEITTSPATASEIKAASGSWKPITPSYEGQVVFYGLAKVAGYSNFSSLTSGTYNADAKTAIKNMLGITELPTVTSSDNGKVLRVVNGAWAAATIPAAEGVNF